MRSTTTATIVARNFVTPVTVSIYLLSLALLVVGESRDAWFVASVITFNAILGTIQEIRAYFILRKIEIMTAPRARVLLGTGGVKYKELTVDKLKVDDRILLRVGDQVPADVELLDTEILEVDESILTGESASIIKRTGSSVLAGSIVVAGEATAVVLAVGNKAHSGKMTRKLKRYKPTLTPLQKRISNAISFLTGLAFVLAVIIFVGYSISDQEYSVIFRTITSAAVVVVPEGLLLASSLFFAYGSMRLAQAKVLPQKVAAIESMALLDVLATDKTGTLTSPEIIFDEVEILGSLTEAEVANILRLISSEMSSNATSQAILAGVENLADRKSAGEIVAKLPFSSQRKISGIKIKLEETATYILGAPEFILSKSDRNHQKILENIKQEYKKGLRVLLLAEVSNKTSFGKLPDKLAAVKPLAIVKLKNKLRQNVIEAVDYLQDQQVQIKVISGDAPETVSYAAAAAGINSPDKTITGPELLKLSGAKFTKAVLVNTIFARVLPHQKEKIIKSLQSKGLYTGMIGDGVNDALAVKQSDLGIAMYDGAPATRRVADLVLLDNSFSALPDGMRIGNQVIQSIELIAILFFHKIILGMVLFAISFFAQAPYPFLPRHVTFLNFILVTLPTMIIVLSPPSPNRRISPKNFWRDTLYSVVPIAIISGLAVGLTYIYLLFSGGYDQISLTNYRDIVTIVVLMSGMFGVLMTLISGIILNAGSERNAELRRIIYLFLAFTSAVIIFRSQILREFFDFTLPVFSNRLIIVVIFFAASTTQIYLARIIGGIIRRKSSE